MTGFEIGIVSAVIMIALIYFGMHVPIALALTSFVSVWVMRGSFDIAAALLYESAAHTINEYIFGIVPLFVLMGFFVSAAGMGRDAYEIAHYLLSRVLGGLGIATVAANALFASVTGSSIASASVFTRVAVPEMERFGYRTRFAVGTVAGSAILGMLIPPSILLIFYAILTEQSVGDLFLAGIGPGLLLTLMFGVTIVLMARFTPNLVWSSGSELSHEDADLDRPTGEQILWKTVPLALLITLVFGGIYGGVFTAIEAGGMGAFAAFLIVLIRRRLTWKKLGEVLIDTGHITASLLFLIIAASMFSRMLGISGLPTQMGDLVMDSGLGYVALLLIYFAIILVLGTVIESISIMAIMVPIFLAALQPFGIDPVWFGIVTVIAVEIGLLTPPLGLSVFVVHATLSRRDVSLKDIFIGSAPLTLAMLFVLLLVVLLPQIAIGLL
ncbi:TRAP transporter large permease [Nitratireductor luteus]|uniref:TRAP transporter large permease n=1 Tax=Nitratireductor luteus TaxID=2976980 RepID=UPI00223FA410|nr:TRAP transporter large permease [Nitratireductor luteus]